MLSQFDAWVIEMARALSPIAPPSWLPMMSVIGEKVTLEIGARGLRSLFSSKPSDKDVARVKRYGALAARTLRTVLAADGPLDAEELTMVAAFVAALGLPEVDAQALSGEGPLPAETLDVYGEIERGVARAITRGAWLAAAQDGLDPREERVIRVIAQKTGVPDDEVEAGRREAQDAVLARSRLGAALVDGVRFVLSDRAPGVGVRLPSLVGALAIPRRWRAEALASIAQGAPVVLAGRHAELDPWQRASVLGAVWAAALIDDPAVSRKALLRARWGRFAADVGDEDERPRELVETWIDGALAQAARAWA
jgi:tellurite resistance protein